MFPFPAPLLCMGAQSVVLWTPSQLSSLNAQYDASLLTGSDGNAKTSWPDQTGSFAASAPSTGPILRTGANGLNSNNVLQFSSLNTRMTISSSLLGSATAGSYFIVVQRTADPPLTSGPAGAWFDGFTADTGASKSSNHPWTDSKIYEHFGLNSGTTRATADPTPSLTSWRIYSCHTWIPASGDCCQTFLDGTGLASVNSAFNTANFGAVTRFIGCSSNTTNYFDGKIAEIVVLNNETTITDRQKMEGYLAYKWGLQANLPVGHPYKSSPPTV